MILLLFFISLITRLLFLGWGMPSITFDEADFYYNGYLLAKTGGDIYGNLFFLNTGILFAAPSIPIYISAFFWKLLPIKSIFFARLPFALINSFTPVVFFLIVKRLSNNTRLALVAFIVLNFSPWFSYLSATAGFDAPLALLLLLTSLLVLITLKNSPLKNILFVVVSFLAFNSYMGIKLLFFPFITLSFIIEHYYTNKKIDTSTVFKKTLLAFVLFSIFFLISYVAPQRGVFTERATREISLFNKEKLTGDVWYARTSSQGPLLLTTLFFNKATVLFQTTTQKYLEFLNLKTFFVTGDPHPIYGTNKIGLFYVSDIIFFIIGLVFLKEIFDKKTKLLLAVLFFGSLTTALSVNNVTVALRAILLIVPYTLLIAGGVYHVLHTYKKLPVFIFYILLTLINFVYFFTLYQIYIKPVNAEQWHLSDKWLVEEIGKHKGPVRVFSSEPKEFFLLYNFYNDTDPFLAKKALLNEHNHYENKNLLVTDKCPKAFNFEPDKNTLMVTRFEYCDNPDEKKYAVTAITGIQRSLYYVIRKR